MHGHSVGAVGRARGAVRGLAPALLALSAAGCDFAFRHDDGDTKVEGRVRGEQSGLLALASPVAVDQVIRADGELLLRFSSPLDPHTARAAVRVVDLSRERDPVAVTVRAEGQALAIRARDERGFRPGARLAVSVAGRPSVRALRARDGGSLGADVVVEADVLSRRRADRSPPVLRSSDPADGAAEVDPDAPVVLVFSEPMDPAGIVSGEGMPVRGGLRVLVDGRPLSMTAHLDRHRSTATLLAGDARAGLPGGAEVVVELGSRLRDAAGNRLGVESPRSVRFRTAARAGNAAPRGYLVESFDTAQAADPLATTAAWADGAHPGILRGVAVSRPLDVLAPGVPRGFSLDPAGGVLWILAPAADLGPEPRHLSAAHLRGLAGPGAGEIRDVRVRVAPLALLAAPLLDRGEVSPWRVVHEGEGVVAPVGPEHMYSFPFRQDFLHDGATDLVLEVSWSGVTGPVLLAAHGRPRASSALAAPPAVPDLRLDAVGLRAVAQSRWLDSGVGDVLWLAPRVRPTPGSPAARVEIQVAPDSPADGAPDGERAGAWISGADVPSVGRWVRFRVTFEDPGLSPPALVDDVVLPFSRP